MSEAQAAAAAVRPGARSALGAAGILWRFSRPHTVIGTTLSIVGLAVIAGGVDAFDLTCTLIAGLCVNLAIVGLNQIEDVEIDRINKPDLPLAAGELSSRAATVIVGLTAVAPIVMGFTQGPIETAAVAVALLVGGAYSSPPLRLKRFPVAAALSITGVRSAVVNLGVYAHFAGGSLEHVPDAVWALTLFVLPFSFAIAILKDVPDIEGDRRFRIRTFSVRLGPERVLRVGLGALTLAYAGMAIAGLTIIDGVHGPLLAAAHLGALALLALWARSVDVADHTDFTRFYMRVWQLFFAEYLIVPLAVLAG